jgi:hypothetical protein
VNATDPSLAARARLQLGDPIRSVVVPVRNEAENIAPLIGGIGR